MSKESREFQQTVRNALQNAPAFWTPLCPEPETLLDWIEQGKVHPQAPALRDHLLGCAYCRREHAALSEIRALSPTPQAAPGSASGSRQIGAWVDELINTGFTQPVQRIRSVLETLHRLAVPPALAVTRGMAGPTELAANATVIRTRRPTLSWADTGPPQDYYLLLTRHIPRQQGRKTPHVVWEGQSGAERCLILPDQALLEPGGLYQWQVTAHRRELETVSAPAAFALITDRMRLQLEALEPQTEAHTLERIGLYEAFGLYDEARQQAEHSALASASEAILQTISRRLQERLSI